MSKPTWHTEKRQIADLIPAKYNPHQFTINLLTKIMAYGIIGVCDKSILPVNNAVKDLSAKKPAKIGSPLFVLANALENPLRISKTAYIAVNNSIIGKINFSVQWLAQVNLSVENHSQNLIRKLWQSRGWVDFNLKSIRSGKAMTWDMGLCTNGFIGFWGLHWFVRGVEVKNLIINKSIGLIEAVNISVSKAIGGVYALNAIKITTLIETKANNLYRFFDRGNRQGDVFHRFAFFLWRDMVAQIQPYCKIIKRRWENHTGQQAIKLTEAIAVS